MKVVTAEVMREMDRRAMASGVPGTELMANAGRALAEEIEELAEEHRLEAPPVLFLCGPGNNGGDGFVAARILHEEREWPVECRIAADRERLRGDALEAFLAMEAAGVPFSFLPDPADWEHMAAGEAEIVVDALLGTGARGEPRGAVGEAVRFADACADVALVVAVDTPSALAVRADLTVTMGLPKVDLLLPENVDVVGALRVAEIGLPEEVVAEAPADPEIEFIHPADLAPLFPRRPRAGHKGNYGHLLCLGGSPGFAGAVSMTARAAVRSGVGLVSAAVPAAVLLQAAAGVPEVMFHADAPPPAGRWTAVAAGPGMGRTPETKETVLRLLAEETDVPLVLDADAIAVLAEESEAIAAAARPVAITPHPGEFALLLGIEREAVQEDRLGMARMAAEKLRCVVVLKGAGTIVAAPERPLAVNLTGNPGMAAGGMGDILTGLLGGLAARRLPLFAAACAAVWLHGRAGDLAAAATSQETLSPLDLLGRLADAFREIACR